MNNLVIREFSFDLDYEQVLWLWQNAGNGIHIQRSDNPNEIQKKLLRDPDLFLVAVHDDHIIGTVMGGFDGRRGMVYHLAVSPETRNQGVATLLMQEIEQRLIAKGCIRCYLFVTSENINAIQFYEQRGWEKMSILPFAKDLN